MFFVTFKLHVHCYIVFTPYPEETAESTTHYRMPRNWCRNSSIKAIYNAMLFTWGLTPQPPTHLFISTLPSHLTMSKNISKKRKTEKKEKSERRENAQMIMEFSKASFQQARQDPSLYYFSSTQHEPKVNLVKTKEIKATEAHLAVATVSHPGEVKPPEHPIVTVENKGLLEEASSSDTPVVSAERAVMPGHPPASDGGIVLQVPHDLHEKINQLGLTFRPLFPNRLDLGDGRIQDAALDNQRIIALARDLVTNQDVDKLSHLIRSLAGAVHCIHAQGEAGNCDACKLSVTTVIDYQIMKPGILSFHLCLLFLFCGLQFADTYVCYISATHQPPAETQPVIPEPDGESELIIVDEDPVDLTVQHHFQVTADGGVRHDMSMDSRNTVIITGPHPAASSSAGASVPAPGAWYGPPGSGGHQLHPGQPDGLIHAKTWHVPASYIPGGPVYGHHLHGSSRGQVILNARDHGPALGHVPPHAPRLGVPHHLHHLAGHARLPGVLPPGHGHHHRGQGVNTQDSGIGSSVSSSVSSSVGSVRSIAPPTLRTPRAASASASASASPSRAPQPRDGKSSLAPPHYNYFGCPCDSAGAPWTVILVSGVDKNPGKHPSLYSNSLEADRICNNAIKGHEAKYASQTMPGLTVAPIGLLKNAIPYVAPLMPVSPFTVWDLKRTLPVLPGPSTIYASFGNQSDNIIVSPNMVKREKRLIFLFGYRVTPEHPQPWISFNFRCIIAYGRYLRFFQEKQSWNLVPGFVRDAHEVQLQATVSFASLDLFHKQASRLLELHRSPASSILTVGDIIKGLFPLRGEFSTPPVWGEPLAPGVPHH